MYTWGPGPVIVPPPPPHNSPHRYKSSTPRLERIAIALLRRVRARRLLVPAAGVAVPAIVVGGAPVTAEVASAPQTITYEFSVAAPTSVDIYAPSWTFPQDAASRCTFTAPKANLSPRPSRSTDRPLSVRPFPAAGPGYRQAHTRSHPARRHGSAALALTAVEPLTAGGPAAAAKVAVPGQLRSSPSPERGEPFEVSASEGTFPSDYQTQLFAATPVGDIVSDVTYLNAKALPLPRFTLPSSELRPHRRSAKAKHRDSVCAERDPHEQARQHNVAATATLTAWQENRYSFTQVAPCCVELPATTSRNRVAVAARPSAPCGPYFLFAQRTCVSTPAAAAEK